MFTQRQYYHILKMIHKEVQTDSYNHMAGVTQILIATNSEAFTEWIVDSGSTNHIVYNKDLLDGISQISRENTTRVSL